VNDELGLDRYTTQDTLGQGNTRDTGGTTFLSTQSAPSYLPPTLPLLPFLPLLHHLRALPFASIPALQVSNHRAFSPLVLAQDIVHIHFVEALGTHLFRRKGRRKGGRKGKRKERQHQSNSSA